MLNLDKGKENAEPKTEEGATKPPINDNFGLRLDQYAKKNAYMKVSSFICILLHNLKFMNFVVFAPLNLIC